MLKSKSKLVSEFSLVESKSSISINFSAHAEIKIKIKAVYETNAVATKMICGFQLNSEIQRKTLLLQIRNASSNLVP